MDKIVRVGIGIFVIKDHKFLMGCRKNSHGDGTWSVPGGHLEFGESVEKGAAREVFEETSLRIKKARIVGITNDVFKKEDKHYITVWVTTHWKSGKEKITEPDKFIGQAWFSFKSLPGFYFYPGSNFLNRNLLKQSKKKLKIKALFLSFLQ